MAAIVDVPDEVQEWWALELDASHPGSRDAVWIEYGRGSSRAAVEGLWTEAAREYPHRKRRISCIRLTTQVLREWRPS